jgi:ABC-type phosphate transport system substrate-binding protein
MYNLKSTVNFPARVSNGSGTAIDNIFIDLSGNITINNIINGLSDHKAQLLRLENAPIQEFTSCYVRIINSYTTDEFQSKLSTESWEDIFEGSDTNSIFNNFLNIYLKIFYACFTKSKLNSTPRYNQWITSIMS